MPLTEQLFTLGIAVLIALGVSHFIVKKHIKKIEEKYLNLKGGYNGVAKTKEKRGWFGFRRKEASEYGEREQGIEERTLPIQTEQVSEQSSSVQSLDNARDSINQGRSESTDGIPRRKFKFRRI